MIGKKKTKQYLMGPFYMVCLCPLRGCQDWIRQARNLLRENIIREKKWNEVKKDGEYL